MSIFKKKQKVVPIHICPLPDEPDLEKLYNENKEFFQEMLIKEFVGYVPREVDEPVLKFFSDHAPMIQKWLLWQSWYINRKAMHDPIKLMRYDGMMVVYAVLYKMVSVSTNIIPSEKPPEKQSEPEIPLIDKELDALQNFKSGFKEKK